ncbi:unnamed protein product [Amaranthus hypochondriacus]
MLSLSSSYSTLFSSKLPFPPSSSSSSCSVRINSTITSNYSSNPSSNSPVNLIIPKSNSAAQPQNFYQPYRPPPSPLPQKYQNLDTAGIIDVLANRLGLWHEYAPLISSLFRDGFTPSMIEELTGISGVEQNRLVVAAQVLESIAESPQIEPETLAFFDSGGSELLYEIRLLSASQRTLTANYIVKRKLDGDKAREIARSIKDFPARQDEPGFRCFDYNMPGDCWAFWHFRLSKEFMLQPHKRNSALAAALDAAETDKAIERVREEIEGKGRNKADGREKEDAVKVPVVRLTMGEVAEATTVVVLPVSKAVDGEEGIGNVPLNCRTQGEFGIVVSDKRWDRWVVLPKWAPLAGIGSGGVAVAFSNARVLPWRVNRTYVGEPVLVVLNRERREIEVDEGFYLVAGIDDGVEGKLKVEKGSKLKEMKVSKSLGMVVVVVRPPKDELDNQLSDIDWD